jgi:hypothetical protein
MHHHTWPRLHFVKKFSLAINSRLAGFLPFIFGRCPPVCRFWFKV